MTAQSPRSTTPDAGLLTVLGVPGVSSVHLVTKSNKCTVLFSNSLCIEPAGLILPVGYPDSVTPDYLAYQLWAVPSHITGWMGSSLITSSLLAAVGLKAGAGTAAAGAASIRWITKDGIGALGRLLVRSSSCQVALCSPDDNLSVWLFEAIISRVGCVVSNPCWLQAP